MKLGGNLSEGSSGAFDRNICVRGKVALTLECEPLFVGVNYLENVSTNCKNITALLRAASAEVDAFRFISVLERATFYTTLCRVTAVVSFRLGDTHYVVSVQQHRYCLAPDIETKVNGIDLPNLVIDEDGKVRRRCRVP